MKTVNLRFFAGNECPLCAIVFKWIQLYKFPYIYVDAFADEYQDLCDENDVDELPHIQIIINQKVYTNLIGDFTHDEFISFLLNNIPDDIGENSGIK